MGGREVATDVYEGWRFERWETPISDLRSVAMVSLVDDGSLHLTIESLRDPGRARWRFSFKQAPVYRNILEEFRMELWPLVHSGGPRKGWTLRVPDSPWANDLRAREPVLEVSHPVLHHFLITTEDDVIDVLSPAEPQIRQVAPGTKDDPAPGKSRVLHADEDADEVDRVLTELARASKEKSS